MDQDMGDEQGLENYLRMVEKAASYHELALFRSMYYSVLESTLSKQDCLMVKDAWTAKASDPSLPVAPDIIRGSDS